MITANRGRKSFVWWSRWNPGGGKWDSKRAYDVQGYKVIYMICSNRFCYNLSYNVYNSINLILWIGASKEIRAAITNQTAESELQAWTTVLPLVLKV